MWLALAIILILLWVGGFLLFHLAAFALHILLIGRGADRSPGERRPASGLTTRCNATG
jgi:hypothetical protein